MKFQLHIDLGNAAMQDNHDVAKALRSVAERLSKFISTGWSPYALDGTIKDDNGNTVGSWEVKPDVEWQPVVHAIHEMPPSKPMQATHKTKPTRPSHKLKSTRGAR